MKDPDIIRKAVELADGWEMVADCAQPPWNVLNGPSFHILNPSTILMDALAAQLVRQVDAVHHFTVVTEIEVSKVEDWATDDVVDTATAIGSDRTMNTIIVIVESGVL